MSAQAAKALCLHGALLVSYLFISYAHKKVHKMCIMLCVHIILCVVCVSDVSCLIDVLLTFHVVGNYCLEWFLDVVR